MHRKKVQLNACPSTPGILVFKCEAISWLANLKGDPMFENDQDTVDVLLSENDSFRRLYDKHVALKSQVQDANGGAISMEQLALEELKKEKLSLKDQMAEMIKTYHSVHA